MLGLQCMLFYIPRIVWQLICCNRTGTDIEHLVVVAHQASNAAPADRSKLVSHVTASLKGMLYQHREYRHGRVLEAKKRLFDACGLLVVSKRLGTWLAFTYFVIKLLYLTNSVGQLYLMQRFLGFNATLTNFGAKLADYMLSGRNWEQTRIFPRISFCYFADLRQLGSTNRYVAQCVLPVNMLNEKLYIFLWYWTAMVAILTAFSIPLWLMRLTFAKSRVRFIKKFLRINEQFHRSDKQLVKDFTENFLHHDGIFILRMISMNAGDVITSEVVSELWKGFYAEHNSTEPVGPEPSAPLPLADHNEDKALEKNHMARMNYPTAYLFSYSPIHTKMSGVDFISLYNKYQLRKFVGVDDWVDRLSYVYSVIILLGFTVLVTSKTYLFSPIACHMPTAPQGANFKKYVESVCWVLGTVPIRENESIPQNGRTWEELSEKRRINYYQWVPFVLGLQCIMFYIPRLVWQSISFNRLGTDLNLLVSKANQALLEDTEEKSRRCIEHVARSLERLLFVHRDYRKGVFSDVRRQMTSYFGFFFVSKRLGTWTVFAYFCIKLLYLSNAFLQLYTMRILLNYDTSLFLFGAKLLRALLTESGWNDTLFFPRKAYCVISLRHLGTVQNTFAGICALPINMFNEKIFTFLYFWISIVMTLTLLSIPAWFIRLGTQRWRTAIVYKYLRIHPPDHMRDEESPKNSCESSNASSKLDDPGVRSNVDKFVAKFLRVDGVFLIHILTANAGDVVTTEIVNLLWRAWVQRYAGRLEWEHPSLCESDGVWNHPETKAQTLSASSFDEESDLRGRHDPAKSSKAHVIQSSASRQ
ncbi:Innexin, partial [Opisthorchis viverrini]